MTVQNMVLALYDKVGNPSDLSPYTYVAEVPTYDITSAGWARCVALLNRAYVLLSSWKTPGGHAVRFRQMNKTFLWQNQDASTLVAATAISSDGKTVTFAGAAFAINLYAMWFCNINGFCSIIVSNDATSITFRDATTLAKVNGFVGTLYKRWFPLTETADDVTNLGYPIGQYIPAPDGRKIISFQRIVNLTLNNAEIVPADRTQLFWDLPATRTHPMLYRFTDLGLEFEMAPVNNDLHRILYYAEPEMLTVDQQVPVIPASWHEIIWMVAAWIRKTQDQNSEEAAQDEKRINIMINERIQEFERDLDEMNVGVWMQ